ncbi:MAG TPA: hypothetical protein VFS50_01895 [Meiothermus sp.]|nr:hypothetical protein [Meiothermus sp.]
MKAIQQRGDLIVGFVKLGDENGRAGSVGSQVHDGDTIEVRAPGGFGVRLLGVDAPEISFRLPGSSNFAEISDPRWETFLSDPFGPDLKLPAGLKKHLEQSVGPGCATNHYTHARKAEVALEREVRADLKALGKTAATFNFFLVFAHETMDRYGRFLAFINRDQPTGQRPLTYNERMLEQGRVIPYFFWPNINPFRKQPSVVDAVIPPFKAKTIADSTPTLRRAMDWVRQARANGVGLFEKKNPLRLLPFELRYLADRRVPERWTIDLSHNTDVLIPPGEYYRVPNPEDRLFLPPEYVPLFVQKGWKKG